MSLDDALEHFKGVDPLLYREGVRFRGEIAEIKPKGAENYFVNLCDAIVSQQLSGKAAETIWNRFLTLFPKKKVNPQTVLKLSDEQVRAVGISYAKIKYIKDLAEKTLDGSIKFDKFLDLPDHEIARELTAVKGIGPWTAEMFLMFTLARPDVFSVGDLGIRNAIKKLYQSEPDPKTWSPYRSYACRILWKSLDTK